MEDCRNFTTQSLYWSLKHLGILLYPKNIELQYYHAMDLTTFFVYVFCLHFPQPRNRLHPSWSRATQLYSVSVSVWKYLLLKSVSAPAQSEQYFCCILGCINSAEKWETVLCLFLDKGATSHHHLQTHHHLHIIPNWTQCREWISPCRFKLSPRIIFSLSLLWYFERLLWILGFVL